MPVNLVSGADIRAISIVGKGANRKRFFLTKADEKTEGVAPLPEVDRVLKAEDWSAVYCVVAEPDAHESPGMGADQSVEDRWASEDEIRKAAHRFMANGGLVTKMHESLEPYGQLVENAVALADFTVDGETIRKGSWYIAIEPSAEGKAAIEKGEFTGVSIEGLAVRELVEKHTPDDSTPEIPSVDPVEKSLLRKIAEKLGMAPDEIAKAELTAAQQKVYDKLKGEGKSEKQALALATSAQVSKANLTFAAIVGLSEFEDALPDAFSAFRESVWRAFFPQEEEDFDPTAHLSQSCDEFKEWCLSMLEKVPVTKAERAEALGVEITSDGSTTDLSKKDGDMALTDAETARIEKLEAAIEALPATVTATLAKALGAPVTDDAAPTPESIAKAIQDLPVATDPTYADRLAKVEAAVTKLGEGNSSQGEDGDEPVSKADNAAAIAKAYESEGLNPALAGVI